MTGERPTPSLTTVLGVTVTSPSSSLQRCLPRVSGKPSPSTLRLSAAWAGSVLGSGRSAVSRTEPGISVSGDMAWHACPSSPSRSAVALARGPGRPLGM